MKDFYRKWFDKSLQNSANTVVNKWLGNYTTAYNTWKRIESVIMLFDKNVRRINGGLRILDIGCGDALPLFILNINIRQWYKVRFKCFGIDISELQIIFAKNLKDILKTDNVSFSVGNFEELPYQDSFFDIIICGEVLEHLEHPEACLSEIKRVLNNDGTAIITTPNEDNFIRYLSKPFKKASTQPAENSLKSQELHSPDEHISVRSLKAWEQTFISIGFSVIATKRHGIMYGGYKYNKHRLLFALTIIIDWMFDYLPLGKYFSEGITYELRKAK